ncbi:MAG: immunogenic protein precursor [Rhodospirillales bacterium]|nr:immunogenic protein precursor [Rhodospirillales bacterium]
MPFLRRRLLLASLPGLPLMSVTAGAQSPPLKLGTATPGGGFPVYGAAFIKAIRAHDPTLAIDEVNTKGSTENVPLLEAGKLDLALVQGEVVQDIFSGAGARGSGLVILGRYVVGGVGFDAEKDFEPVYLDRAGDGPAMVIDGRVAALWGGGARWPGFVTVANAPGGARFIVPEAAEIDRILAKYGFLKRITVPAGTFPGQAAAMPTVGSWSFVLARPGLDEAIGHRLAAALHKVERAGAPSEQLAETTAKNTLDALPAPGALQPGVARYDREIGLLP